MTRHILIFFGTAFAVAFATLGTVFDDLKFLIGIAVTILAFAIFITDLGDE